MNNKEMTATNYEATSNSGLDSNKSASGKNHIKTAEDLNGDGCREEERTEQQNQQKLQQQEEEEEDDEQEQNRNQTIESTMSSSSSLSLIIQNQTPCNSAGVTFIAPNSPSSSSSTSKNNGDSTFEPTVDMMVNDFDDEQTLEEEEALAAQEFEDPTAELSNLQKESDMPIEELLALYNCNGATIMNINENRNKNATKSYNKRKLKPQRTSSSSSNHEGSEEHGAGDTGGGGGGGGDHIISGEQNDEEDDEDDDDIDEGDDEDDDDDDDDDNLKDSQLRKLYPETYGNSNDKRLLRTISRQQSDEEDDGEYSPDEDELKKTIMVGSEFQAVIPEGFFKYDDVLPYENEDKLLWDPSRLSEKQTEEYLQKAKLLNATNNDTIPYGNHLRDDEQALYLLLQCGHNTEEALRRKRLNPVPSSSDEMSIWSEEECRNFESGIRVYGKDFYTIKHTKVRTRSVGELVQFYYLWKKTERHDVFANKARLEKKKYSLHPGLTDYMDRFLEEQESNNGNTTNTTMMNLRDRSSSPAVVNCLLQADTKRQSLKIHHHNQSSSSLHHHISSNSLIGSSSSNSNGGGGGNERNINCAISMNRTSSTTTATVTAAADKEHDNNVNLSTIATNGSTNKSYSSSLSSPTAATVASSSSSSLSTSNQEGGNSNVS